MTFSQPAKPIFRPKQSYLDVQDIEGLLKIHWKIGDITLFSGFYTRVDQACLLWGLITLVIFAVAQFVPISWIDQAQWWSILSVIGTVAMVVLTRYWVRVEGITWLLGWWAFLMLAGVGLTNLGIFWGWTWVLPNLCPLWLILCVFGYIVTAFGLGSRAFILAGIIHLAAIPLCWSILQWQFLITGLIMAGTLVLLAEAQWDMRPPVSSQVLTQQQLAFNRQQERKRQTRDNNRDRF
ncbi:MAG: hypothetical protein WBA77_08085 [Microcoleaceae cyanobacterium]